MAELMRRPQRELQSACGAATAEWIEASTSLVIVGIDPGNCKSVLATMREKSTPCWMEE
jgi:hypothetical protein